MLEDSFTASIQYINVTLNLNMSRVFSPHLFDAQKVSPPSLNDEAVQKQTWNMSG